MDVAVKTENLEIRSGAPGQMRILPGSDAAKRGVADAGPLQALHLGDEEFGWRTVYDREQNIGQNTGRSPGRLQV